MRLYGRDEIELVEDLGPDPPTDNDGTGEMSTAQPTTRFLARVCATGRNVTVRRFSRPDASFKNALGVAKKIWCVYQVS